MTDDASQPGQLAQRVIELRAALQGVNVLDLASRAGAEYDPPLSPHSRPASGRNSGSIGGREWGDERGVGGVLRLPLWGVDVAVTIPDFVVCDPQTGQELPVAGQALLLYYFHTCDGAPETGRWVSFAELPDGRFYNRAFQGYTGHELAKAFQSEAAAFVRAAESLGGQRQALGDAAFSFRALPRVTLLVVFWQGDEEFPASFQILFDAAVSHHLPTDVCAILGSMLTRKLIKSLTPTQGQ